jgi:hypothetical protein
LSQKRFRSHIESPFPKPVEAKRILEAVDR